MQLHPCPSEVVAGLLGRRTDWGWVHITVPRTEEDLAPPTYA
jgi:hypothetical protein